MNLITREIFNLKNGFKAIDEITFRAFSLRKINLAYNGYCIRVVRSIDYQLLDIGFVNGVLDTGLLLSFAQMGSAYVETWYDQSGNGANATQVDLGKQPRIVNEAVLETVNGKPSVYFNGVAQRMETAAFSIGNSDYSVLLVSKSIGLNSYGRAVMAIGSTDNSNGWYHALSRSNILNTFRWTQTSDGNGAGAVSQNPTSVFPTSLCMAISLVPKSGNVTSYLNKVLQGTSVSPNQTINNAKIWIGNYYQVNSYYHQGNISEIIMFDKNISAKRIEIEDGTSSFYAL